MIEHCKWFYRPGTRKSGWASAQCDHIMRYLSKLGEIENNEEVGCADAYNDHLCINCGKPIVMDYSVIIPNKE